MFVKICNSLFFRIYCATKFECSLLPLNKFKRFGAPERTLVKIFLNSIHALETKSLTAKSFTEVQL